MAKCDLCGQDAGRLHRRHGLCEVKRDRGSDQIIQLVSEAAQSATAPDQLLGRLHDIAQRSFIDASSLSDLIASGWERAVDYALEDDVLTREEETSLIRLQDAFGLSQGQLDGNGAYTRVAQAGVIRDLLQDKLPQRMILDGVPLNLQKGESLVWRFLDVDYRERRTTVRYSGTNLGVGVGVAGVYLGLGRFRGRPIPVTETVQVDRGILVLTNMHLYFDGADKKFRIPYPKIVSFTPYSDGIGVQSDEQAPYQLFLTQDGWFTYNLVTNLARLAAA